MAIATSQLKSSWIWMAIFAAISLVGGLLALANPFEATLAATLIAGWVFIAVGVLEIIQTFSIKGWGGFIWSLLLAVLMLAVGLSLVFNPLGGMVALTVLVAVLFITTGVVKILFAFSLRPISGWGWVLASGVVSLALGVMILLDMPWSATNILGILLGVELLSNGLLFLFVAMGLRNL